MARITIKGPDGQPEEVHLLRAEQDHRWEADEQAARAALNRMADEERPLRWLWRWLGWLAASIALAFAFAAIAPDEPWPQWLAIPLAVAVILGVAGRRR